MDRWEPIVPAVEQVDKKAEPGHVEKRARSRSSSRSRSDKRRAREESAERRRRRERDQSAERRRRRRDESAERRHRNYRDSRDERTPRGSGSRRDSRDREPPRGGGGRGDRHKSDREGRSEPRNASDDRRERPRASDDRRERSIASDHLGDRYNKGKEERGDRRRSTNGDRASERGEEPAVPKIRTTPPRSNGREKREASGSPTPRKRPTNGEPPPPTPPAAAAAAPGTAADGRGAAAAATPGSGAQAAPGAGSSRLGGEEAGKPAWGLPEPEEEEEEEKPVEKANFGLSGALAQDTATGNVYRGIVLKWSEPPDARRPNKRWRLYSFKENELIDTLHIHRQSAFLVGREQKIADLLVAHPTCSKQHAVIQFRYRPPDADAVAAATAAGNPAPKGEVLPYIMDLESANGTYLNDERIEHSRYIELREKDTIKFGRSSREYVLLHEDSAGD